MKTKVKILCTALALFIGAGTTFTLISQDSVACSKCNTSATNRKCGKCGSSRLLSDPDVKDYYDTKHKCMVFHFKCKDCGHTTVTKVKY